MRVLTSRRWGERAEPPALLTRAQWHVLDDCLADMVGTDVAESVRDRAFGLLQACRPEAWGTAASSHPEDGALWTFLQRWYEAIGVLTLLGQVSVADSDMQEAGQQLLELGKDMVAYRAHAEH